MWWMAFLLAARPCALDGAGFCKSRTVEATLKRGTNTLKLNLALGQVTTVVLPESAELVRSPKLGNQVFYAVEVEGPVVSIWAKPPAGQMNAAEYKKHSRSNLQLFLGQGVHLSLGLRVARRAVEQVRLLAPQGLFEAPVRTTPGQATPEKLEALQDELQTLKKQMQLHAELQLAEALLGEVHCKDIFDRAMKGLLVLTARRICRMGPYVAITVETLNRRRSDLFRMHRLEVSGVQEGESPSIEAHVVHEGGMRPVLRFKQQVRSVLLFEVEDPEQAARTYEVTVTEDGGRRRKVQVEAEF